MNDPLFEKYGLVVQGGERIFNEGDLATHVYVIQHGQVTLFQTIGKEECVVDQARAGDFFGEMALIRQSHYSTCARADMHTKMLRVDQHTFEQMLTTNISIAVRLMQKLATKLEETQARLRILSPKDSNTRVIVALLQEAKAQSVIREGAVEGASLFVAVPLAKLCELAQVQAHEVEDVFLRTRRLKICEVSDEGFMVHNIARLEEFLLFLQKQEEFQAV